MSRKRNQHELLNINDEELPIVQVDHMNELETNPEYSLEIDPQNKYEFSPEVKSFIGNYIEFRNLPMAAQLSNIPIEKAREVFGDFKTKNEIRRINKALYQRQFASKMLSLDQLGGYLSSMLTDDYTPLANQLSSKDKLKVVELILEINDIKKQAINNPTLIINKDINLQLKELSIESIKQLLEQSKNKDQKVEIIENLNHDNVLSIEDKAYLETLPLEDLIELINETNKSKGGNNE